MGQYWPVAAASKSLQSCPTLCDQPRRRQPTRLPRPWDSPGKNTGVGCHFLLQGMKVKVKVKSLSCVWLNHPMDCSPPGSSVHGIFQARVLEWGAIAFSQYWPAYCKTLFVWMDCDFSMTDRKSAWSMIWGCKLILSISGSWFCEVSRNGRIRVI